MGGRNNTCKGRGKKGNISDKQRKKRPKGWKKKNPRKTRRTKGGRVFSNRDGLHKGKNKAKGVKANAQEPPPNRKRKRKKTPAQQGTFGVRCTSRENQKQVLPDNRRGLQPQNKKKGKKIKKRVKGRESKNGKLKNECDLS